MNRAGRPDGPDGPEDGPDDLRAGKPEGPDELDGPDGRIFYSWVGTSRTGRTGRTAGRVVMKELKYFKYYILFYNTITKSTSPNIVIEFSNNLEKVSVY